NVVVGAVDPVEPGPEGAGFLGESCSLAPQVHSPQGLLPPTDSSEEPKKPTALIRFHVPHALIKRLDRLAGRLSSQMRRQVPRAALVRAIILTQVHAVENREKLTKALGHDPVKRGRPGALRGGAIASLAPSDLARKAETPNGGQRACREEP